MGLPSLRSLCLASLVDHVDEYTAEITPFHLHECLLVITPFERLDDHDIQDILQRLADKRKLSLESFLLCLNSTMRALDLSVCSNFVTDAVLKQLQRCPLLQTLSLAECRKISPKDLTEFLSIAGSNLESLDLSKLSKAVSDAAIGVIAAAPNLHTLALSECNKVSARALRQLLLVHPMKRLDVDNVDDLNADVMSALRERSSASLTSLNISFTWNMNDAAFGELMHFSALSTLYARGCPAVTDTGIAALARCTTLTHLDVSDCELVTERGLQPLSALTSLRTFGLNRLPKLRSATNLLQPFGSLESLGLEATQLDGDSLEGLFGSTKMNTLQNLNLKGAVNLSDDGLAAILSRTPALRTLDLSSCTNLTETSLSNITRYCPVLNSLTLASIQGVNDTTLERLTGKKSEGVASSSDEEGGSSSRGSSSANNNANEVPYYMTDARDHRTGAPRPSSSSTPPRASPAAAAAKAASASGSGSRGQQQPPPSRAQQRRERRRRLPALVPTHPLERLDLSRCDNFSVEALEALLVCRVYAGIKWVGLTRCAEVSGHDVRGLQHRFRGITFAYQ